MPGAELVLPWLSVVAAHGIGAMVKALGRLGFHESADLAEAWRSFVSLEERDARRVFLTTVRSVLDLGGQRVSGVDKLYLASELPMLIVWGERDPLIPVAHAYQAHALAPRSRLEIFSGAGHFPHLDDPERFATILLEFLRTTRAQSVESGRLRDRLLGGSVRPST